MSKQGFLEDEFDDAPPQGEDERYVLSLLPYEATTTYGKGTRKGPEAIVEASSHVELLDETLRIDASSYGVATRRPEITDLASVTKHAKSVAAESRAALLGFLGGEHSLTPAIIAGLGVEDIGIVWLDAHADLRKTYCGREDNHACAGYNSLPFGRLVQIGIRSLAAEEARLLDSTDRVECFRAWGSAAREAIAGLPDRVYLSIDLDGLNPMLMRAVGTPEPGGLSWEDALDILDVVFGSKDVVAFDTVELCPRDDDIVSSFTAARLVYKVLTYHAYHKLGARPGSP